MKKKTDKNVSGSIGTMDLDGTDADVSVATIETMKTQTKTFADLKAEIDAELSAELAKKAATYRTHQRRALGIA